MKNRIPVRTLIIDDDESVCRALRGWLTSEAFEVATFTDPSEGLRHITAVPYDLALVDLRLPDAVGSEVISTLCAASPKTRVVAMSAFPDPTQVRNALQAGAHELIEKPIQPQNVVAALDRQLAEIGIAARTEDAFNRRLGERVRLLRKTGGRTQSDISSTCGITAAQLSQIELGKTGTSAWTLARICGSLKVSLTDLFDGL